MASTAVTHDDHGHGGHGHGKPNHPYHLVDPSPWPLVGSLSALLLTGGGVMWMHEVAIGPWVTLLGFLGVLYVMYRWWGDVLKESASGAHSEVVAKGLRLGMALFITSEVFFFFAFFWAFFWGALYPPMTIATSVAAGGHRAGPDLGHTVPEHPDPPALGRHGDLGAPRGEGGRPEDRVPGAGDHRVPWPGLHWLPGARIRRADP